MTHSGRAALMPGVTKPLSDARRLREREKRGEQKKATSLNAVEVEEKRLRASKVDGRREWRTKKATSLNAVEVEEKRLRASKVDGGADLTYLVPTQ